MARTKRIIKEIKKIVQEDYHLWEIGATDNAIAQKAELGNPLAWAQWEADSVETAAGLVQHFSRKGMKTTGERNKSGCLVYIFFSGSLASLGPWHK